MAIRLTSWTGQVGRAFEPDDRRGRIIPMEGIRGLAVLLVFAVHYYWAFAPMLERNTLSFQVSAFIEAIGHAGVDLFFLLSGYLIYGGATNPASKPLRFIGRRIQRIYPAYLAVFVIYIFLSRLVPEKSKLPSDPAEAAVYLLQSLLLLPGIFNISPFIYVAWSLSYEMLQYLALPITAYLLNIRKWPTWARIVGAVGLTVGYLLVVRYAFFTHFPSIALSPARHPRMVMFFAGAVLFEVRQTEWFQRLMNRKTEVLAIALFMVTLMLPAWLEPNLALPGAPDRISIPVARVTRTAGLWIGCFAFVAFAAFYRGRCAAAMSWRPLRWLGNMSYSYYLSHSVTMFGLALGIRRMLSGDPLDGVYFWALLAPVFATTLLTSAALYLTVEFPFSLSPSAAGKAGASSLPPISTLIPSTPASESAIREGDLA